MTAAKDKGSPVTAQPNAAGDVGIGYEVDGTFVPLVTIPADRVAILANEAAERAAADKDDDKKGGS